MPTDGKLERAFRLGAFTLVSCLLLVSSPQAQWVDCDGDGTLEPAELTVDFRRHGITWGYGALPSGFSMADLNGDGSPDAIWSLMLATSSTLSWQANDGSGVFGPAVTIHDGASGGPGSADLDGDGDLDIVARVTGSGLSWFDNLDGAGSFGPARLLDPDAFGNALGDLDGDDDVDVLVVHSPGGGLFKLTNLGGGVFSSPALLWPEDAGAGLADLNGDGALDIYYWKHGVTSGGVLWMRNVGAGLFDDPVRLTWDPSISGLVAADLDGDGDLDLANSRSVDESLRWHENLNGQAEFGPARRVELSYDLHGLQGLAAGDLDGDGDTDLLAYESTGRTFRWENFGGANFGQRQSAADAPLVQGYGYGAAMADVDGDGVLDFTFIAEEIDDTTPLYSYYYLWQENRLDDCNANGVPDKCEIDCNENGRADACDLMTGFATDCDGNRAPDVCDVGCSTCDVDGDGCLDEVDADPVDPAVCGDSDTDGCDDCSAGGYDPGDDGQDADGDGSCWIGDCADDNGAAWNEPGDALRLTLTQANLETHLEWEAPGEPGGTGITYDLVRSSESADFHSGAACVEAAEYDTEASDASDPGSTELYCYLVRVENHCPGEGAMGSDSGGHARSGMICP